MDSISQARANQKLPLQTLHLEPRAASRRDQRRNHQFLMPDHHEKFYQALPRVRVIKEFRHLQTTLNRLTGLK